jgi:nucleoid-associated protein YgaU
VRLRPGQVIRIPNPKAYRIAPARQKSPPVDRRNLRQYEVQEGDSLGSIAQQHLGRASRYGEIVELNPGLKPRNLKPGQKIFLPRK